MFKVLSLQDVRLCQNMSLVLRRDDVVLFSARFVLLVSLATFACDRVAPRQTVNLFLGHSILIDPYNDQTDTIFLRLEIASFGEIRVH